MREGAREAPNLLLPYLQPKGVDEHQHLRGEVLTSTRVNIPVQEQLNEGVNMLLRNC